MEMNRPGWFVAGCTALALVASACGSDGDDDSAGPSGGAADSTGASSGSGGSGGIAGSQPEGSGGASSGGTGGSEIGGTAGTGGTSGASSGGTAGSETGGTAGSGGTGGTPSGGTGGTPSGGSSGTPSGGSSGTPSGGSSGTLTGGSGGQQTGGSSGAEGGTAGQGGTGGAGGNGGAGVLDPPSPGIACGDATCDEDSQQCCGDDGASLACYPPAVCQGLVQLGCDDSVDCPGQVCCFGAFLVNARIGTRCGSECRPSGLYNVQVCKEADDCDNGDSCHTFVCGGFDTGNVTLGLCTATAPEFCE